MFQIEKIEPAKIQRGKRKLNTFDEKKKVLMARKEE